MRSIALILVCAMAAPALRADLPTVDQLRKADRGDAAACAEVALAYANREKGKPDYARAVHYAEKALALDPKAAMVQATLGLFYFQGRGVPRDPAKGRALIEAAAAAGDEAGQALLAELKKRGHLSALLPLAEPDPAVLRKAEDGDAGAQQELADAYANGWIESPPGKNAAREWRERAAESGSASAQLFLAEGYLQGAYGYSKDVGRGMLWLQRAADQGDARAAARAGEIYYQGKLQPRNDALAAKYLKHAAAEGAREAEAPYGILLVEGRGTAADPVQGAQLLAQAERRGDVVARRYLYREAAAGRFAPQDDAQVMRLLEQGVKDGDIPAKANLGLRLYTGQGATKDIPRAAALLEEAAKEGNFEATKGYVDYLGRQVQELSTATGPLAAIKRSQAADYMFRYREALILYGCNGQTGDRLTATKQLTGFAGPDKREVRDALKASLDQQMVAAIALVRIYRKEGGKDRIALGWLDKMEKFLREGNWKNASGQTAMQMIEQKQRDLENFIAAHRG